MEINNSVLNKDINLLSIEDFDLDIFEDLIRLKRIYKCLFSDSNTLFFAFRREENLTDKKELKKLKVRILESFKDYGEYIILKELDSSRFDSVGRININDHTYNFLFDVWKYFYSCTFFIPTEKFNFFDYITFQKKNRFHDIGNEKLLINHYANFSCIKGLGGDNLIISYRNDFKLPDLPIR
ncbi:hypothetical protein [Chryseobacterium rhizosphaerae]|uniref:Uncharacterized protein n=2 Tax=Chryseobacterium TaxID=59732 RepID=A0AAE3YE76_9FLAO|nr:hypothetical protein [Chryseobacterium rhizosphaerae]MDR6528458.1 hypothetical protein [Chryseobacterium rhizosphaerae]REC69117.1 hypothetical protein DRF57_23295 [Chryseobacterium rhizosphaerae]GEN69819.1 hypothetical protein CRH01_43870 [Chryseobacterium rhizosphaerae]